MSSVIFLGTPNFGSVVLQGLIEQGYEIKAVVTQPDKRVGRKQVVHQSTVKETALKHNLPVYQPAKLSGSEELAELMKIEPPVNVHGSLLPKYRGGAPIQYSVLNGDKETGITIMEMVKKMDAGDIFAQKALPITDEDTSGTLFDKLSILGRDLLLETLPKFIDGTVTRTAQDGDKVVFSPNISKDQEKINLSMTAKEANNLIRALNPDPGAYFMLGGKRFKVWKAKPLTEKTSFPAGTLVTNKKKFVISMADGSQLELLEVQPTGKKKMNIKDYLNGQGSHFTIGDKIIDE